MKKPPRSTCVWVLAGLLAVTWIGGQALAAEAAKSHQGRPQSPFAKGGRFGL